MATIDWRTPHLRIDGNTAEPGGQRFPRQFPPRNDGLGARFIFPRLIDGKPYITAESGDIHFVSELSQGGGGSRSQASGAAGGSPGPLNYRLDCRFKVAPMNFQGKLEY